MKPGNIIWTAILLLAVAANESGGAPVNYWFERANALYEQQSYDSAGRYYEMILSSGIANSSVYYNLGNSYFRLKKVGLALLSYERAARLSPNDPDILVNIRFANSAIIDRLPPQEKTFVEAILFRLHTLFSLTIQLWLLFFLLLTLSILFSIGLYASPNARLWIIYLSTLLLVVTCAVGFSAAVKIYSSERTGHAIVLTPSLDAKNQPGGNKVLFTVHEGTKFKIRKTINDWSLVSLPTGVSGWVLTSSLGRI